MNCKEVNKYLDAYIDEELEAGLMLKVEEHLESCQGCGSVVLVKRKLKRSLSELGKTPAPDHLRRNIVSLSRRRQRGRALLTYAAAPLAAAAALVIILVFPSEQQSDQPLAEVVEDVVNRHVRELPMEVQGPDPALAASWFRGKVDFPVRPSRLNLKKAHFQGARLSNVQSHQAAHMTYTVDGHRVTVMIFNPNRTLITGGQPRNIGSKEVRLGRRNGFNVAVFFEGDMAYAISSDLPQERLVRLIADSSIAQH